MPCVSLWFGLRITSTVIRGDRAGVSIPFGWLGGWDHCRVCVLRTHSLSLSLSLCWIDVTCPSSVGGGWWGWDYFSLYCFVLLFPAPGQRGPAQLGQQMFFFIFVVRVKSVLSSSPQNKGVLSSFSVNMSRSLQNKDGLSLYFALPFHFHPVSARRRPFFRLGSSTRGPCIQ